MVAVHNLHVVAGKGESGGIDVSFADWSGGSLLTQDRNKGNKVWLSLTDSVFNMVPDIFLFFPTRDCLIARNVFISSGGVSAGTKGVEARVVNNVFYMQSTDFAVKNWYKQPLIVEYPGTKRRPDVYPKDMVVQHNSFLCTDRVVSRFFLSVVVVVVVSGIAFQCYMKQQQYYRILIIMVVLSNRPFAWTLGTTMLSSEWRRKTTLGQQTMN